MVILTTPFLDGAPDNRRQYIAVQRGSKALPEPPSSAEPCQRGRAAVQIGMAQCHQRYFKLRSGLTGMAGTEQAFPGPNPLGSEARPVIVMRRRPKVTTG